MIDKQAEMTRAASEARALVSEVFPSESDAIGVDALLRSIMDSKQLAVFDLALRCETEMYKCEQAGAYLSGCLMGAAMNEACLSLLCLSYKDDVKNTHHYRNAKLRETYEAMIGQWKFEHLIRVAKELDWMPNEVVDPITAAALLDAYLELMPVSYPKITQAELEVGAAEFESAPGIAMLRLIQELRNSIHSGSWIRGERRLDETHFDTWCRIAIRVSGETRNCLLHCLTEKNVATARAGIADLESKVAEMKDTFRRLGENPAKVDELLNSLMTQALKEAQERQALK